MFTKLTISLIFHTIISGNQECFPSEVQPNEISITLPMLSYDTDLWPFFVNVRINNQKLRLIVDTGSSNVALKSNLCNPW